MTGNDYWGRPHALFRRWGFPLAIGTLLAAGLVTGCSEKERFPRDPAMVPIAGVVTIDGEPAQGVKVIFATKDELKKFGNRLVSFAKSSGMTNEKGEFAITTVYENDGVLPGEYTVAFEWMPPGVPPDLFEEGVPPASVMKRFPPKLTAIHDKYSATMKGNMTVTVEPGKPQKDLKFELTSGK